MSAHTPGPWVIGRSSPGAIVAPSGLVVADANMAPNGQMAANARLIAAAPDLLAALVQLRKACNAVRPFAQAVAPITSDVHQALDAVAFMEAIADADAALAKAGAQQ